MGHPRNTSATAGTDRRRPAVALILAALCWLLGSPSIAEARIYEAIVVNADTGEVLHQANANMRAYPASLTKMMTLYMLFDAMQRGDVTPNTRIRISHRAAGQAPAKLGLNPGAAITAEQAIFALVTKSANDIATAVAEHLAGSEYRFCLRMTKRAREMGMTRTQFRNASGLPHRGQLSTARDMAILSMRLLQDFPEYFHYFAREEFPYGGRTYKNHNRLLKSYEGTDGIKTGYTAASGFNLAATAHRGDHRIVTVVFGGRTAKSRDNHVAKLMDAGFRKLELRRPQIVTAAAKPDSFPDKLDAVEAAALPRLSTQSAGDIDEDAAAKTTNLDETWGIQIGAYGNRITAASRAAAAQDRLQTTLKNAIARVEEVQVRQRTLYRAQVIGLEQNQIAQACHLAAKLAADGCRTVSPSIAAIR